MRLTTLSDYALRVLMYAAAENERLVTIDETAKVYDISKAHLMKVVNILTKAGYLKSVRGRFGGFMLAMSPEEINLGAVVRTTEPDFALVECFATGNQCVLTRKCELASVLNEALVSFVTTLDRYTLADIILQKKNFRRVPPPKDETRGPDLGQKNARASSR
ncbi:Rrf2 family transcriptional regulator [Parvibaculum sp.]|jgi:Rrf2 family transcriptional regulator, nitric oxide-sensitive transcriptional repressor|uniref:RrF2 family transcriptional regulator n=1 Tax=Parvibaculum sp. TaxID=2024848 RepID=UPI000C436081|nr:Rrf2 family transcriptional regulator [Parvibaculum sp.]MAM93466.1 BadM/Rrf2 family transcriptional regulator [Parvibaculum sp.]|tara:strand:- start:35973 stop:36458 length:486 start_codon:yes stop_codon:yes gene_type:complete